MDPDQYLEHRVDDQLRYYEAAATRQKRRHIWTQSIVIAFGTAVPVIVNLPESAFGTDLTSFAKAVATLLSLTVAILTGLANFRKFDDLWLSYRMTEELLKREKYLYLTRSGDYSEAETAFPLFVERVEQLISVEHSKFQTFIKEARRPTKPGTIGDHKAENRTDTSQNLE